MILKMFSIYDSKAKAFLPPFFLHTEGMAIRTFADCAKDPQHAFSRNPQDYTLFCLGSFEDTSGMVEVGATPQNLGLASGIVEVYNEPVARIKPGIRTEA